MDARVPGRTGQLDRFGPRQTGTMPAASCAGAEELLPRADHERPQVLFRRVHEKRFAILAIPLSMCKARMRCGTTPLRRASSSRFNDPCSRPVGSAMPSATLSKRELQLHIHLAISGIRRAAVHHHDEAAETAILAEVWR